MTPRAPRQDAASTCRLEGTALTTVPVVPGMVMETRPMGICAHPTNRWAQHQQVVPSGVGPGVEELENGQLGKGHGVQHRQAVKNDLPVAGSDRFPGGGKNVEISFRVVRCRGAWEPLVRMPPRPRSWHGPLTSIGRLAVAGLRGPLDEPRVSPASLKTTREPLSASAASGRQGLTNGRVGTGYAARNLARQAWVRYGSAKGSCGW